MAKSTKKKNRRLRKQIRKTIGALFMASAVAVAAIPVQEVAAEPNVDAKPESKVWVWDTTNTPSETDRPDSSIASYCESTIPYVPTDSIIYTSGDGRFQFAYVDPGNGIKVAVILNYNATVLADSSLEIPNTMEAFRKYKTTSTEGYYCLVTQNDEFMFYDVYEQDTDEYGRLLYLVPEIKYDTDKHPVPAGDTKHHVGESLEVNRDQLVTRDNKLVYVEKVIDEETSEEVELIYQVEELMVTNQKPCYYEQRNLWGDKDDSELYYQDKGTVTADKPNGTLIHPTDQEHYRIDASVKYIGQQFVDAVEEDGNLVGWEVREGAYRDDVNDGVFANNANITNLVIGENLSGISDYAFQGCATLSSVTFGNDLTTIGNGAFANCIRLSQVNMPENSNIQALGKDAFYNCTALTRFDMPINVKAIGDSCFEGCTRLQTVDLCGSLELDTMLKTIGNSAFKNCTQLTSLTLPSQYNESSLQIGIFEGCSNLQYVKAPNAGMNFAETTGVFTFDDFKDTVPESFYFWGADTKTDDRNARTALHLTANANEIAYKYFDKEVYEVVILENDTDPTNSPKVTYQVNDQNELVKIWAENSPKNVEIPKTVGPYGISTIGTGCFNDVCTIERVTIPASVTNIESEAFKGSHNIKTIIFDDATTVQSIGPDAFRTQEKTCGCTISTKNPELTFVGSMINSDGQDTVPFVYAMTRDNMINNADQYESWITCHSGWPTNLEVKYEYDFTTEQGGSTLIGYPRYSNFVDSSLMPDESKITSYVATLPYVNTSDNTKQDYLVSVIKEAIQKYEKNDKNDPPTEKQTEIVNASKNVVVPTNVDSLKEGLFSGYGYTEDSEGKAVPSDMGEPDTYLRSVVLNGVDTIDPFTFTGCTNLQEVAAIGATELGDYAFGCVEELDTSTGKMVCTDACTNLGKVTLGSNIVMTGLRPFRGCTNLTNVECLGSNLSYQDGLLYNLTDGKKALVQCLPGRGNTIGSYTVGPEELANVDDMQDEAFMDCNDIGKVDLSQALTEDVPADCFNNCDQLNSVILPDTTGSIEADAFINDPLLRVITIPASVTYIEKDAFESNPTQQKITFECADKSAAERYANQYDYINSELKVSITHMVYFWDYPDYPDTTNKGLFYKTKVNDGEDAVPPTTTPSHEGHPFTRWTDYTNISRDTDVYPVFGANTYKVEFRDYDGSLIGEIQFVEEGRSATVPADPVREGYTFDKWSMDWNNVTEDRVIVAMYIDNSGDSSRHTVTFYDYDGTTILSQQSVNHGESAVEPKSPTRNGYKFVGWVPATFSNVEKDLNIVASYEKYDASKDKDGDGKEDDDDDKDKDKDAKATPTPSVKKYTVSVSGGSGSGSYAAGDIVAINAYFRGEGQSFDKWTTSTAGVGFANNLASSTTFTMPATNVAVTATYKVGGSSTAGGSSNAGTSGGGSASSGTTNHNGSSVQITKPGISNTGLAGATVSGATDNFVVKVTEDQNATNAVVTALQTRYGDISRIKYWPVDISLYDSTGRTKIADTSGISVNITLPIPDDFIQYAGNNKVAAVSGGVLEDLNTRFTTVDGVPCVNFTASHFSPYVIYVDTANLTAATIDTTPKTGDPIHPKWFLSVGMACISLILFFKRDKAGIPVKTA